MIVLFLVIGIILIVVLILLLSIPVQKNIEQTHNIPVLISSRTVPLIKNYKPPPQRDISTNIPRVIIQTGSTSNIPENIALNIDNIKRMNPDYEYIYFDGDDMGDLSPERFIENYLYLYGGIYIDTSLIQYIPLRESICYSDELILCKTGTEMYSGFIACKPGHEYFKTKKYNNAKIWSKIDNIITPDKDIYHPIFYVRTPPQGAQTRITSFSKPFPEYPLYSLTQMNPFISRTLNMYPNGKIPKIIIQTNDKNEITVNMYNAMMSFIRLNPEYDHYIYSAELADSFVKANFSKEIYYTYFYLTGLPKSLLFRACYLYINGGIYVDSSSVCCTPFREFLQEDDCFVCSHDGTHLQMNMIASTKKHPILENYINSKVRDFNLSFSKTVKKSAKPNVNYGLGIRILESRYSMFSNDDIITDGQEYGGLNNRVLIFKKYRGYQREKNSSSSESSKLTT